MSVIDRDIPPLHDPEVDSLSARQVDLLLRTVRWHQDHLDGAHHDARHMLNDGRRPAYVLDFDLLYHYIFDASPDWSHALEYLFGCPQIIYLIGPGTRIEVDRFLAQVRPARDDGESAAANSATLALSRLSILLDRPNVRSGDQIPVGVDDAAYQLVKQSLDFSRHRSTEVPNQADALNWAYVVHLRRNAQEFNLDYFPYLLTGTTLLLDEQALDPHRSVPISRGAQTAIYSEVLTQSCPDPTQALRHTVEIAFQSAQIERSLRLTPAYLDPSSFEAEYDWEKLVSENRVSARLRAELETLAEYVHDSVLYEAQRIYDNMYFAATTQAQLGGTYPFVGETPRRLFDLISAVSAALEAADGDRGDGLTSLWSTVLELEFIRPPGYTIVELVDRAGGSAARPPYLAVEVHPPVAESGPPLFIMRWPSSRDAASIVDALTRTFASHGQRALTLTMGTPEDVYEFDAVLPITLDDMREALATAARDGLGRRAADPAPELMWFRGDSPSFDLYADIQAPLPQDAIIGVFGEALTKLRITSLYAETSSRYIFPAWLRAALVEAGRLLAAEPILVHPRPQTAESQVPPVASEPAVQRAQDAD